MDWNDIRYFHALAQAGSLAAAARELGVEHTTIARRVQALEESLGVRLFQRLPRGWKLTSEGAALQSSANDLADRAAQFLLQARSAKAQTRTVRVSVPPVVATHLITPLLPTIREALPDVAVELIAQRSQSDLAHGEADLALRVGASELSPAMIARPLGSVGYGFYAAQSQRRAAELLGICGFSASMQGTAQKQWVDEFAGKRPVVFSSNDLLVLKEAAKQGLGIALLPHFIVTPPDRLFELAAPGQRLERSLTLLVHEQVRKDPAVRQVSAFLVQSIANKKLSESN